MDKCGKTSDEKKINSWAFLKRLNISVYCICLKSRDDRYQSACKALQEVGILKQVKFYRPLKHPTSSRIGCWQSHLWCMKHAYKHGKKAALIFEDDVIFTPEWEKQLSVVETFLKDEPDWNLFRIGSYILKYWEPALSTNQVFRTSCVQTHAYFVDRIYIQAILNSRSPQNVNHIDSFFNHSTTKDYALLEPIVYQDAKLGSDNLWNFKFKNIDIDFGVITQKIVQQWIDFEQIQKINNSVAYYARHLPKSIRFNTLPNIVHHNITEPVLLL